MLIRAWTKSKQNQIFHQVSFVEKSHKLKIKILLSKKMAKKNRKIIFTKVSEYCVSFGTKKSILQLLSGVGVLHVTL